MISWNFPQIRFRKKVLLGPTSYKFVDPTLFVIMKFNLTLVLFINYIIQGATVLEIDTFFLALKVLSNFRI